MDVYDVRKSGALDATKAKLFLQDAILDFDRDITVSDAELETLLGKLDSTGLGMLSVHDILQFFRSIADNL